MVFTKKQEEELRTLTYEALRRLTGRYSDAYTTISSVSCLVAYLATGEFYGSYHQDKIPRILNKFCREGKAEKVQIVVYSPVVLPSSRFRVKRKHYVYRVSS